MRTLLIPIAAAWLLFAAAPGTGVPKRPEKSKPVNLLVNGSFEEGPEPGRFLSLDKGSTAIKGWTVTRGQIDYVGTHWEAAHGKRSIDLHGSPGFGGIQQTFATKKGKQYRVKFSLAGTPGAGPRRIGVRAAGQKGEFRCESQTTLPKMNWTTQTWVFKATTEKTTLEIHTLETTDPERGPVLDNVSVVAVVR
jgi:choice-of-anchor C domain-containing protein